MELKENLQMGNMFNGFSTQLINEVVCNCSILFALNDSKEKCCVYSVSHSLKILDVLQEIFLDIPNFDETMDMLNLVTSASISHVELQNVCKSMDLTQVLSEMDELSPDEDP